VRRRLPLQGMISGCFEYVSHWSARTLRRSVCKIRHIDWAVQLYPVPSPQRGRRGHPGDRALAGAPGSAPRACRCAKPDRRQRATDRERRLLHQFDDLELLGCAVPPEASSPSPRTLFLSRRFSIKTSASVSSSWRASALSTKASGNLNAAPAFAAEGLNLLELNVAFDLKRETNPAERHCCLGREPLVALEFALR